MALSDIVPEGRLQGRWHPCEECAAPWSEHWEAEHRFVLASIDDVWSVPERELNAQVRRGGRRHRGLLDPPLPSPAERKRIREKAGFTQAEVADVLHVSPDTDPIWTTPCAFRRRQKRRHKQRSSLRRPQ